MQVLRITFKFPYRRVKFSFIHRHQAAEIYYYDVFGLIIDSLKFPISPAYPSPAPDHHVDFWALNGKIINYIEITVRDNLHLDDFSFEL